MNEAGIEAAAERLGVTDRHLRRVFEAEFGVSPVAFAQTQRLLLAKRLLTDTRMPVTEVAIASGFGSLRRFNALFRERYRLRPRDLRKASRRPAAGDALAFELGYRPPYEWERASRLSRRARASKASRPATATAYRRTVRVAIGGAWHSGWIEVAPAGDGAALRVRVAASLGKALPAVLARVKQLFDLACRPAEIARALGALAARGPGLRVPGAFDGFEMAVRAVLGQQMTVAAARTLAGRIAEAFGDPLETPFDSLQTFSDRRPDRGAGDRELRDSACRRRARARSGRSRARSPAASSISRPARTSRRRSRSCARCPAWANGPRNMSRCARSRGRTHSRTPTTAS